VGPGGERRGAKWRTAWGEAEERQSAGKCLRSPRERPGGRDCPAARWPLSDDARFDEDAPSSSRLRLRKTYCSGTAARPGMPADGPPGWLAVRASAFEEAMWY
jgi:hypothetical protein